MSDILCSAGGHEAGSQSATCSWCEFHNGFVEQLTYVLVNRALEELPHAEDPLVKQLTQALVYQEIKELPKQRREAAFPEEAAREVDS